MFKLTANTHIYDENVDKRTANIYTLVLLEFSLEFFRNKKEITMLKWNYSKRELTQTGLPNFCRNKKDWRKYCTRVSPEFSSSVTRKTDVEMELFQTGGKITTRISPEYSPEFAVQRLGFRLNISPEFFRTKKDLRKNVKMELFQRVARTPTLGFRQNFHFKSSVIRKKLYLTQKTYYLIKM